MTNQPAANVDDRLSICLLGASLETSNRGVSALAAASSKLISTYFAPCDLTLLVPGRNGPDETTLSGEQGTITLASIRYSRGPRKGLRNSSVFALCCALVLRLLPCRRLRQRIIAAVPLLCTLEKSVLVADLFAGDSFSDIYGLWRLLFRSVPRWCVTLLKKPYILLPQTYGPFKSRTARLIAVSLIGRAAMVFARTKDDSALRELPVKSPLRVRYCPDVAFALDADVSFRHLVRSNDNDTDSHSGNPTVVRVGLNISGLLYNGGYCRSNMFALRMNYQSFVSELVAALLTIDGANVVLIPHTYSSANLEHVENDLGACLKVASCFPAEKHRLKVIGQELDQHQIKGVIGGCDLFIGSRLHACIAALSQGVVTVGVGYSKKFTEVFSALGVGELVVDARSSDNATAIETISRIMERRDSFSSPIRAGVTRNQRLIHESFQLIKDTMIEASWSTVPHGASR